MSNILIQLKNLTKNYGQGPTMVHALRNVDLDIEKEEFIAITGPSGSGKSTLLNIIGCMDNLSGGDYSLSEKNISRWLSTEIKCSVLSFKILH